MADEPEMTQIPKAKATAMRGNLQPPRTIETIGVLL
jgi:hypothetical protein